ncbi:MAG: SCO6745 family protein [Cumulibacter sp.]
MTNQPARAVARALEPFAGQVYFAPECHERYQALGFGPSPGDGSGVQLPNGPAYFCSRGSVMGQVSGEVVAAAFGVFNPAAVVPAVSEGWTLTDADTICAARTAGAVDQLRRVLGESPDGLGDIVALLRRATDGLPVAGNLLYAGLVAQDRPNDPLGEAWWLTDQLREFRGDVHVNPWTIAGFDAAEIGLLTELYWGLPPRSYVRTRAWSDADLDAAQERLESRGLLRDGALTTAGRAAREDVEVLTDQGCARIVNGHGDGLDTFVSVVGDWSRRVRAADGYPSGPKDVAPRSAR